MYRHEYHQSLVYKIWLCGKPGKVVNTFEQVLEHIRRIHDQTLGVPQICYLVGWQFEGHDSKYPAWSQVNDRLKRPEDAHAVDSLHWLMREAKRYNATVSLHINMCDAYESSPLWDEYVKSDLLVREADGALKKGGIWGGEQSYLVCKTREWADGQAKKRIDALLKLLPLAEVGTVHIDVFQPMPSPYHGVTREDEMRTIKSILAYWRSRQIDVTAEWWHHDLVGLVPMVYHSNFDEASRLKYPPDLACGGGSAWNMRQPESDSRPGGFSRLPEPGCLFEEAWGHSVDHDLHQDLAKFSEQFYLRTLPFIFLNRFRALSHSQTAKTYEVQFSGDVWTQVHIADRHLTIRQQDRLVVDGSNVFLPAPWRKDREYIAFSRRGGEMVWTVPPEWGATKRIHSRSLLGGGVEGAATIANGILKCVLLPHNAIVVRPADE